MTAAVRQAVAAQVKLPPGVYLEYEGTADAALAARNELLRNVGFALVGMIALLSLAFGNPRSSALILAAAPLAMVGGVIAVLASGRELSLGSWWASSPCSALRRETRSCFYRMPNIW